MERPDLSEKIDKALSDSGFVGGVYENDIGDRKGERFVVLDGAFSGADLRKIANIIDQPWWLI